MEGVCGGGKKVDESEEAGDLTFLEGCGVNLDGGGGGGVDEEAHRERTLAAAVTHMSRRSI